MLISFQMFQSKRKQIQHFKPTAAHDVIAQ